MVFEPLHNMGLLNEQAEHACIAPNTWGMRGSPEDHRASMISLARAPWTVHVRRLLGYYR
jgi:predicted RNA polymerase sigma factor